MTTITALPSINANNTTQSFPSVAVSNNVSATQVQDAVTLSSESGILLSLGLSTVSLTYDAVGLYNSVIQAGSPTTSTPTQSLDQAIVGTLATSPTESGIYTSTGIFQSLPSNTAQDWTTVLASNSNLSSVAVADAFNQGIVNSLSTYA